LRLLARSGQNAVMSPRAARKKLCRLALVFAVAAAGFFPALAAPPDYFTRTWQVEQGLPQNKVTAVVQARDGYLWAGTYNGLARFDGVRFTVFDDNNTPELRSRRITSLFEAGDGTLWIGTESGDVSQYKDGRFAAVPLHASWGGGKIYAITADDAGDVWLLNTAGELARARDGKVLSPPSGTVTNVVSLERGRDGTIWVDREGAVSALKNGRLTNELSAVGYVQGFCAARGGGFWVACNSVVQKRKDGQWAADLGAAPWGGSIVPSFIETSSGALAAGTPGFSRSDEHPRGALQPHQRAAVGLGDFAVGRPRKKSVVRHRRGAGGHPPEQCGNGFAAGQMEKLSRALRAAGAGRRAVGRHRRRGLVSPAKRRLDKFLSGAGHPQSQHLVPRRRRRGKDLGWHLGRRIVQAEGRCV
jgi:hypothetical protein